MSLLDDLRNLLTKHLEHVSSLVNQGTVHLIKDHLNRLAAVGPDAVAAEEAVHKVLTELYAALNAAPPVEQPVTEPAQPADTSWAAAPAEPSVPAVSDQPPTAAAEAPAAEQAPANTAQ